MMEQVLFTKISKEVHEQERKLAIIHSLGRKINPVILVVYFLFLAADGMMYFYALFYNGHPRSLWISIGIAVAFPIVLSVLHKALRAWLYPKAEAGCTVTIGEWTPDRFPDMDAILAEKSRLVRKYSTMLPALPVFLSAPVLVLCYRYIASLPTYAVPQRSVLHLVLICVYYSVYGFFVVVSNCENANLSLSPEADTAVRKFAKKQSNRRIQQEEHAANRRMAEKEHNLNRMVYQALKQNPPDFKLLYKASSQGAADAIAKAGRALVPLMIEKYPKCWQLESADRIKRRHYDEMVDAFEKHAVPLAEAGDTEVEFALIAVRYYTGRPTAWMEWKEKTIPRIKKFMKDDSAAKYWGGIPQRLVTEMEHAVEVQERMKYHKGAIGGETSRSDDIQDDLDAIQAALAGSGICDPLPDLTTDV